MAEERNTVIMAIQEDDLALTPAAAKLQMAEQELGMALRTMTRPSVLAARLSQDMEERRTRRLSFEQEWVEAYQRWLNQYPEEVRKKIPPDKSHLWVGLTAMKVNSAHSAIMDFLRGNPEDKPWSLEAPRLPDSMQLPRLLEGSGVTVREFRKAVQDRVENMSAECENQLDATEFDEELDLAVLEAVITGSGCMEGPLTVRDQGSYWEMDMFSEGLMREVSAQQEFKPIVKYVPIFNVYPDMEAPNVQSGSGVHKEMLLTRRQMIELALRPGVDVGAILELLKQAPNGTDSLMSYQSTLRAIQGDTRPTETKRWSVKVFYGDVSGYELRDTGLVQIDETALYHTIPAEVWYSGRFILKARVRRGPIPLHIFPYNRRGNVPFGRGVPMLAKPSQDAINGAARAIMDNAAIASGPIVEMNVDLLAPQPGKNPAEVSAWDVILSGHSGEAGKKAVNATALPAYTNQFILIIDKFRQFMDEETFLPSLTQGIQGFGTTKTATGMSLLNTNANKTLKKVMRYIDDRLIEPIIRGLVDWNLRFNPRKDIQIPVRVVAKGSASLLADEVKTQRLLSLLQIIMGNPSFKSEEIVEELAKKLGVQPSSIVFSEEEKAMIAAQMQAAQGTAGSGGGGGSSGGVGAPGVGNMDPRVSEQGMVTPGGTGPGGQGPANPGTTPMS